MTGATGVLAATAPLSYNSGTQTVSVPTNAITAANIANRTRRVAFTSNQFITQTVSQFNLASQPAAGARTIRNNFFSANDFATGTLTLAFVVPPDYTGVSSGNLATNPGLQALGLRISGRRSIHRPTARARSTWTSALAKMTSWPRAC